MLQNAQIFNYTPDLNSYRTSSLLIVKNSSFYFTLANHIQTFYLIISLTQNIILFTASELVNKTVWQGLRIENAQWYQ